MGLATARRLGALALAGAVLAGCSGGGSEVTPVSSSTPASTRPGACDPALGRRALDVRYARRAGIPSGQTSLDVYTPSSGCPAPVVMWVHGGGWTVGDKRFRMFSKIVAFTTAEYVLVSVNYRLLDPEVPERVRYPAFNEDVAEAVSWVRRNIARFGGDPRRIALVGHSAGAAIAASVAVDRRYLREHDLDLDALRCVAPLDTEAFDLRPLASSALHQRVFGSDPAVLAEASPITHVAAGRDVPPFLVVQRGTAARRAATDAFVASLQAASVPVTVVEAAGLTHEQVSSQLGDPGDAVITPPLLAFLEGCLRPR
jgi:acetyl esterase/lipase